MTKLRNAFLALATAVSLVFVAAPAFADGDCGDNVSITAQKEKVDAAGMGWLEYSLEDSAKLKATLDEAFPATAELDIDQFAIAMNKDNPNVVVLGGFKKGCTVKIGMVPAELWKAIEAKALKKGEEQSGSKS